MIGLTYISTNFSSFKKTEGLDCELKDIAEQSQPASQSQSIVRRFKSIDSQLKKIEENCRTFKNIDKN